MVQFIFHVVLTNTYGLEKKKKREMIRPKDNHSIGCLVVFLSHLSKQTTLCRFCHLIFTSFPFNSSFMQTNHLSYTRLQHIQFEIVLVVFSLSPSLFLVCTGNTDHLEMLTFLYIWRFSSFLPLFFCGIHISFVQRIMLDIWYFLIF